MKVLFFFRSTNAGPSIRRVFAPIERLVSERAETRSVSLPYYRMIDCWKNMRYVSSILKTGSFDIVHITGDVYFLLLPLSIYRKKKGYKTIVTVHDLGHYTQHKHTLMHFFYYWLWIRPIKLADHITFISKKSFEEGDKLLKLNAEKVSIVSNPVMDEFRYAPAPRNEKPRILHVGTGPNKNLENVIKALNGVPCHRRVISKLSDIQVELLKENGTDYSNVYNISDDQILEEYKQCDVVSFPSLYEGFGMPIIEGQAVGRVVVTSNREPMRTIAGNGAILVDPEDVRDIKRGFQIAISCPRQYVERGLENCKRFSPHVIANRYFDIYCGLLNKSVQ